MAFPGKAKRSHEIESHCASALCERTVQAGLNSDGHVNLRTHGEDVPRWLDQGLGKNSTESMQVIDHSCVDHESLCLGGTAHPQSPYALPASVRE